MTNRSAPNLNRSKQQTDYLTVSATQEFRSNLVGWFWFRVSHKAVIKVSVGAEVISRLS